MSESPLLIRTRFPSLRPRSQPSEQDDILSVWGPDLHTGTPPQKAVRHLLYAATAFAAFFGLVYYGTPQRNFIPRVSSNGSS